MLERLMCPIGIHIWAIYSSRKVWCEKKGEQVLLVRFKCTCCGDKKSETWKL